MDSPEKIIEKALKLLEVKNVANNLVSLIEVYRTDNDILQINLNSNIEDEIINDIDLKKIDKAHEFIHKQFKIKIIIANMRPSMAPDSSGYYGDLFVFYNNECVLHNSISREYSEWGSNYQIGFYEFSLKKLKAGNWIDDLHFIVQAIKAFELGREIREKEAKLKETASKIDLSGFKL